MEAIPMSRLRYDQQEYDAGGLDWPKALVLVLALAFLAPALVLGLVGFVAWRQLGWSRRAALTIFALSLVPAGAAAAYWHHNPVETFLEAQLAVVMASWLWAVGHGYAIPADLTLPLYLLATGPAVLPLACLVAGVAGWKTRPRQSLLQQRQAEPMQVPRHVERRASSGVAHPPDGFALGYRADGKPVTIADAEARQHVLVCGSTGAGKTTAIRHVLDGVAHRHPVVLVDCKASHGLRCAVEAIPGSLVWTIGARDAGRRLHRAVGPLGVVPVDRTQSLARLADVAERTRDYVAAAKAPNTLRAYRADWADFAAWCAGHRLEALPAAPETVALYLTALAGQKKAATLQRRLSAISQAHQAAGLEPPTKTAAVRTVWAGIRHTHGTAQAGKAPVVVDELRRMVDALPASILGCAIARCCCSASPARSAAPSSSASTSATCGRPATAWS
jgi:hypothetical protein